MLNLIRRLAAIFVIAIAVWIWPNKTPYDKAFIIDLKNLLNLQQYRMKPREKRKECSLDQEAKDGN